MGRPKVWHFDTIATLQSVFDLTFGRQAEIEAELKGINWQTDGSLYQELHREKRQCDWARYRLDALAGRSLGSAEHRAYHRHVAELENQGLVEIAGQRGCEIRLTPEGLARIGKGCTDATRS